MAPNSATNSTSRKSNSRMVQPALPLLPALRPRKAKSVTVVPGQVKADTEAPPQTLTNGDIPNSEPEAAAEEPPLDTSQDVFTEEKEVSPVAGQ